MDNETRKTKLAELNEAQKKMAVACQNGSKKAWRKYGKKIYILSHELNVPVDQWIETTFSKLI